MDKQHSALNINFDREILSQIKKITTDCFKATWGKFDPYKRINTFEVLGFDFMLDDNFKVYLIEVNTNPCLETSCPILQKIIPAMLENTFRIAIDPLFPPPYHFSQKKGAIKEICPENKYELIFDEHIDGTELEQLLRSS